MARYAWMQVLALADDRNGAVVMDPVTVAAVLGAIAGGAGGAVGEQLWNGVVALARRPFRRRHGEEGQPVISDGSQELAVLEQAPGDQAAGLALARALISRAGTDGEFARELEAWWARASRYPVTGDVASTISGGRFSGPVIQGRDFTNLTFNSPAPVPAPEPPAGPGNDAG
jgi:hypothetical protein